MFFNRHHPQKTLLLLFNVISCLTIIVFSVIIFQQSRTSKNYGDWVQHTYQVLNVSHQILNTASEMESSYRGYFLTGTEGFLSVMPMLEKRALENIHYLTKIAAGNEAQSRSVEMINEKFRLFTVLQRQQQETYKIYGSNGLVQGDINAGRQAMSALQSDLNAFIDIETAKLKHRLFLENSEHKNQISTIVIGAAISILGLIVSNALISLLKFSGARTAKHLETIKELYEVIQENINDGLYDLDLVTNKVIFSPSYKRQLGYDQNDLSNFASGFGDLLHPDDAEGVWASIERFKNGEDKNYNNTYRMRHKSGDWIWMLSRGIGTWVDNHNLVRMVGIHTDISAQKKQEEALRELNNEMESFTYIASHDLRSPLVNLKGFAKEIDSSVHEVKTHFESWQDRLAPDEKNAVDVILTRDIPESLTFIDSAVERMDSLTGAILSLSRIGRRVYRPTLVDVNDVVSRCLKALNYEIAAKQTEITVHDLPKIHADALAIEQLFSNIIENAVKYLVADRPGKIVVAGAVHRDEILFSIADNGRGIDEKDVEKIFSIFRRARNATDIRGVGMGLAFVKATIRKMGGRIWYESVLGEGTCFYLSLPRQAAKETTDEAQ